MRTPKIFLILLPLLFFSTETSLGQTDTSVKTLEGHTATVWSVCFSPNGRYLASASGDETVRIWEVSTAEIVETLEGHGRAVYSVCFSPDGRFLASGGWDEKIKLWEVSSGQLLKTLKAHADEVLSIAFSADGQYLASGSKDETIKLWEVSSCQLVKTLKGHTGRVLSVAFSPDGRFLASAGWDEKIKLWEVSSGQLLNTMEGSPLWVYSVAFSPDGRFLANGSSDNTIKLWEVSSVQLLKTLEGHTSFVLGVAFSPDGRFLASGSRDKSINLWEVSSGEIVKTLYGLYGHNGPVTSVAFSPDGRYLASGSSDKSIKLWDVSDLGVEAAVASTPPLKELHSATRHEELPALPSVDTYIPQCGLSNPNAVAVVIGNKSYEHRDVPAVEFAISDASVFQEYLVKTFGLKPGNIIFETDANLATFNAIFGTKDNPEGKLYRYIKADKSDVYIYYSGHGAPDPDTKAAYFLPVDCDPSVVALNGYSLDTFYDNLKKLAARSVTVILDACFSGVSEGGQLLKGISPVFIEATQGAGLPSGTIFTSAEKDQVSTWYEEKRHSLFTYFFLSGLRGLADINKDGTITVGEMADFLQDRAEGVPYWAGRLKNREQTPTVFGTRSRVLVKY